MLFVSYRFLLLFLPAVLCVAYRLKGRPLLVWIFVSSLAFYALEGQPWFLLPMLFTTVLDYFLALVLERSASPARRRVILAVSLCGNLGLLAYFKYSGLFAEAVTALGRNFARDWSLALPAVVLPAGISFYTFQTLSYMIDVYRREAPAEKSFFKFAGFVSFFPHLVAGPLTRHHQLIPSLTRIEKDGIHPRWREGVFLFTIGFSKKILLADRLGEQVDRILLHSGMMGSISAWHAALGYCLQIYFDFSGYSDMAIGLGRLFDVELPQNFNSPYQAVNPSDFWKRWHMTLSLWLRDYLYIPLGGSRHGTGRRIGALAATMLLGGLWHGANWTFAAWGLYHGLLLIAYHLQSERWDRLPGVAQRAGTFLAVTVGWVLFRARSFGMAKDWLAALLNRRGLLGYDLDTIPFQLALYIVAGLILAQSFPNASGSKRLADPPVSWQIALGTVAVVTILFMNYPSSFLYYQF